MAGSPKRFAPNAKNDIQSNSSSSIGPNSKIASPAQRPASQDSPRPAVCAGADRDALTFQLPVLGRRRCGRANTPWSAPAFRLGVLRPLPRRPRSPCSLPRRPRPRPRPRRYLPSAPLWALALAPPSMFPPLPPPSIFLSLASRLSRTLPSPFTSRTLELTHHHAPP
jgi:hypothetical protein